MTLIIFDLVNLPIILLSFLLPTMIITFFKNNIPSFFFFTIPPTTATKAGGDGDYKLQLQDRHHQEQNKISESSAGLGLIISAAADEDRRPPNVVESAMLKPPPPSSPDLPSPKKNGFVLDGEVDGLMCCTESIGFESSDERRDLIEEKENFHSNDDDDWRMRRGRVGLGCPRRLRSYPPPLTSLNRNGERSFFLVPVRKNGRLELTEVRIHRPETMHVLRHDGRLTLHLIPDDEDEDEENEEIEQEEEEEEIENGEIEQEEEVIEEEEEGEEQRIGEWKLRNEGGLRRCHEMVSPHHHHHHLRMCGISIV